MITKRKKHKETTRTGIKHVGAKKEKENKQRSPLKEITNVMKYNKREITAMKSIISSESSSSQGDRNVIEPKHQVHMYGRSKRKRSLIEWSKYIDDEEPTPKPSSSLIELAKNMPRDKKKRKRKSAVFDFIAVDEDLGSYIPSSLRKEKPKVLSLGDLVRKRAKN